jgi:hypothetical protein
VHENDQVMVHPSDSEAWKALDDFDADFTRMRGICALGW